MSRVRSAFSLGTTIILFGVMATQEVVIQAIINTSVLNVVENLPLLTSHLT